LGAEVRVRHPIAQGSCLLAAMLGYAFFQHKREEFADAL
jgi:hypothetical protein